MSARQNTTARQASAQPSCPHTAELCSAIACEASIVVELLDELIGEGNQDSGRLHAIRLQLARMGWMADTLIRVHGGSLWRGQAADWFGNGLAQIAALKALTERGAA